jgi:MFS family permease
VNTFRRIWEQKDYRWLWAGQSLSAVGDQMIVVTIALYITERTGSSRDVGLVLAAWAIALVAFILIGGAWADRRSRKRIMVASDLIRFAVQGATAVLIFTGDPPIWLLAVLNALFGAAQAFFEPAYNGLLPRTVPDDLIQEAQAFKHTSYNVASFVGPAIATTLALTIGFGWVYAIDAATFALSAVSLAFVRPGGPPPDPSVSSVRADIAAGFREVRSRAWVWVVLVIALVVLFTALAPFYALGAAIGEEQYGSSAVFGWFQAATGVGALIGALAALRWRPERPLATGSLLLAIWPLAVGAFALGAPLPLVMVGGVAQGFAFAVFLVWWDTALAERIPPESLSRVSSYDYMVSLAMMPAGYLLAGFLGDRFDPSVVLAVGCAIALVVIPMALFAREIRDLRRIDRTVGDAPRAR